MRMQLWRVSDSTFNFRVYNKQFIGVDSGNKLVATSTTASNPETFQIIRNNADPSKIRIQASNGMFLQVYITYVTSNPNLNYMSHGFVLITYMFICLFDYTLIRLNQRH